MHHGETRKGLLVHLFQKDPKIFRIFVFLISHFLLGKKSERIRIFVSQGKYVSCLIWKMEFFGFSLNLKSERNLNLLEETSDSLWSVNERKIGKMFTHHVAFGSLWKKKSLLILTDLLGTSLKILEKKRFSRFCPWCQFGEPPHFFR